MYQKAWIVGSNQRVATTGTNGLRPLLPLQWNLQSEGGGNSRTKRGAIYENSAACDGLVSNIYNKKNERKYSVHKKGLAFTSIFF